MNEHKKVVKYRKPFNINIGVIIFIIIFIYLVFNVFTYITTTHTSVYEVEQGTMAENNVYRGLILRDETIVTSQYAGSLNYYVRESSRVGYGDLICSVDESGSVSQKINDVSADASNLDAEGLLEIENDISDYENSYQAQTFYNIYSFKENIDSALNEGLSLEALNGLSDYTSAAGNGSSFHTITTDTPGILVYYTDGFENTTTDNFSKEQFDEASYQRNNLKQNVSVSNGDAVYKLISNEEWHIVVPITNTLADELADDNTLKLRFNKDGKTAYATYVITEKSGEKYLILTLRNSLVRYAKDRFIEIELLLTEQTGLKIPNSAITEKEFFTIPVSYFMKGGDSDADGLLVSSTNKNGKTTTEFVSPTIYYTTDDYYYIDSENVTAGDILVKPDSNETYRVGSDTATLKGVYNVNKGYAVFKQIDILYQSKEYTIVKTGTSYGISLYDHIALDGAKINEDDLLK